MSTKEDQYNMLQKVLAAKDTDAMEEEFPSEFQPSNKFSAVGDLKFCENCLSFDIKSTSEVPI